MNWYLEVFKKYAIFSGRARRKEYWYFVLFSIIVSIILAIIDGILGSLNIDTKVGLLNAYQLIAIIPSIAVSVRRLHDTNRTSWWLLIGLIPFIGTIVLFVFMVQDSKSECSYGVKVKTPAKTTNTSSNAQTVGEIQLKTGKDSDEFKKMRESFLEDGSNLVQKHSNMQKKKSS